jgi:SRSO17 transposase
VQRQYTGTSGKIDNCQLGVFLGYASVHGRALADRELYLPWTSDRDRCRRAGIGDGVGFATKPELARRMVERAVDATVPSSDSSTGRRTPHGSRASMACYARSRKKRGVNKATTGSS